MWYGASVIAKSAVTREEFVADVAASRTAVGQHRVALPWISFAAPALINRIGLGTAMARWFVNYEHGVRVFERS